MNFPVPNVTQFQQPISGRSPSPQSVPSVEDAKLALLLATAINLPAPKQIEYHPSSAGISTAVHVSPSSDHALSVPVAIATNRPFP